MATGFWLRAFPEQEPTPDVNGDLSDVKKTLVSLQVGAGYDIYLSSQMHRTQFVLSPFISYQPYFGQSPRTIETMKNIYLPLALLLLAFSSIHAQNDSVKVVDLKAVQVKSKSVASPLVKSLPTIYGTSITLHTRADDPRARGTACAPAEKHYRQSGR